MTRAALLLALAALAGCATPVAPTGGPADTAPPTLVRAVPAAGATRVAADALTLTFSERLDPATAARAVRLTPEADGGAPPRVSVRGATLEIALPPLREATTYVVTVGAELADARGVRLAAPLTVAFSTGDRIDAAQIAGTVRHPATGRAAAGLAVWAYALPDTSAAPPDPGATAPAYRTETGADGRFRLAYLRPGPYFVVAVADANRSGRADPGEAFAAPPRAVLRADTLAADSSAVAFWTARADTTAPTVRSVRALTRRRLSVRLSEPVVLRADAGGWAADDSAAATSVALRPYQAGPTEVVLVAPGPLPAAVRLRLASAGAVADSSGRALAPFARSVATGAAPADTLSARVAAWVPAARADSVRALPPGTWPGARFTAPPDTLALRLADVTGAPVPARVRTDDGLTLRVVPTAALPEGAVLTLTVAQRDTLLVRRYRVAETSETGGIVGTVPDAPPGVIVEATPEAGGPPLTARADAAGRFALDRLWPGRYRLRLWADADADGRWSPGRLWPYLPPEPLLRVAEPVAVRARWDTDVEPALLRLP